MDILLLLTTFILMLFSGYSMVLNLLALSFSWQGLLKYVSLTVILFVIVLLIGSILNRKFKKILNAFVDGKKDMLSFNKLLLRTFGVLIVILLPFLLYLFIFSIFAVIEFIIYGYTAITSLPRIPIGLLIGLAIVGIGTIYAIGVGFYYLFFSSRRKYFGIVLEPNKEKKLRSLVNEVSKEIGAKSIDKIIINSGASIGVFLEGNFIKTIFGGGKRVLEIGISGLHDMTVDEFKAILAHEYGHFSNKDTQRLSFTYVMGNSLISALKSMPGPSREEEQSWITLVMSLNPAYRTLFLYVKLFFFVTNAFSRVGEVRSDVAAMKIYGGKAFRDGLKRVSINDLIFSEIIEKSILPDLLAKEKIISNFSIFMDLSYKNTDKKTLKYFDEIIMNDKSSSDTYDSHPATGIRIEYSKRFDKKLKLDKILVSTLFDKWDKINERVAELYNNRLISNLQNLSNLEEDKNNVSE